VLIYAKLKKPIVWQEGSDELVDIVFMLGVPKDKAGDLHLQILAKLARKLMDDEFTNNLRNANTPKEAFAILTNVL